MTALGLAMFAAAVTGGVPGLVSGAGWVYRAPQLGLLAWQASAVAAVLAAVLAGLAAVLRWDSTHHLVDTVWRVCLDALLGAHGPVARVVAVAGLLVLLAVAVRLALGWWYVVAGTARQRRRHRSMLRLAGAQGGGLAVVAGPEPVAYLVPGRQPQVVVSTATLARLSASELAAVLAHERAHATGRHDWLIGSSRLLARAFPGVSLFARTARETSRLVEMCADDRATGRHSRLPLARALVAMADPAPPGALRSTGGNAVERLQRLLEPPPPLPPAARALVAATFGALPLAPLAIIAVGQLISYPG